jgi:hypothetical protein
MLSNEIPKCNSSYASDLAKRALQSGPVAKTLNITVFETRDSEELSYDVQAERRTCAATAFLSSGKQDVSYTMEWLDKQDHSIGVWLEIKSLGNSVQWSSEALRTSPVASAASQAPGRDRPSSSGLPDAVAGLPAVIALQRNDPAAFARFSKPLW